MQHIDIQPRIYPLRSFGEINDTVFHLLAAATTGSVAGQVDDIVWVYVEDYGNSAVRTVATGGRYATN